MISILKMYYFIFSLSICHSYPILSLFPTLVFCTSSHGMFPSGLILVTVLRTRKVTDLIGCTIHTVVENHTPLPPWRVWAVGVFVPSGTGRSLHGNSRVTPPWAESGRSTCYGW